MTLKPWREIAVPHEDVLKGTFQQAEFAADLSRVHDGTATPEYQNPALFFQRTFITEGMRLLLNSVVKRLVGKGADPFIQLQTAFGGGKTHTMLAVYHLVNRDGGEALASDLAGVPAILDAAGVTELPRARIAVLDGIKLSPNQPVLRVEGDVTQAIRTLWGDLAWQLGKAEGYALVADADASGTSPGKAVLETLLSRYAPCVILIDELVAYVRQFEEGKTLTGGSFDSNLSFVQALKAVPTAVLLRETYKWMLAPMQEAKPGKGLSEIQWEHFQVNPGAPNLSQEIERVLKENELLITEWAPIHLAKVLRDWFWKDDVKEVSALNVWQQSCQQLYLPRLKDDTAFQHTMAMGTESQDFFGFAQGKEDGCYVGFSFDQRTTLILDSALLLIEPVAAAGYAELQRAAEEAARPKSAGSDKYAAGGTTIPPRAEDPTNPAGAASVDASAPPSLKKQFYGNIELDPILAKKQFADLVDEVILQFTSRPGIKVRIAIEIQAETATGFDDGVQRAVKENCKVLRFKNAEFENQGE